MSDICAIRSLFNKNMSAAVDASCDDNWPRHLWSVSKCTAPMVCHQLRFAVTVNTDWALDRESLVMLMLIALFQPSLEHAQSRRDILHRRNDYLKLLMWWGRPHLSRRCSHLLCKYGDRSRTHRTFVQLLAKMAACSVINTEFRQIAERVDRTCVDPLFTEIVFLPLISN